MERNLNIVPGFHDESSELGTGLRWRSGSRVRFYQGMPQPIGGWQQAYTSGAFLGRPSALHAWISLDEGSNLAVGTHSKMYINQGGAIYNITPIRTTGTLGTDPVTTSTAGSGVVNIEHASHGATIGAYVAFGGTIPAVDGITLDSGNYYEITEIVDSDNYIIDTTQSATSGSTTGGGSAITYSYEINPGSSSGGVGLGWGAGTWGSGTWGSPRTASSINLIPRIWSITNWGEDLVFCPRGGAIYLQDYSSGLSSRASAISGPPSQNNWVHVSATNRHMVSFGCHDGSSFDPMLVRWCDQNDYTDWTPTETNTAGDARLDEGHYLMSAYSITGNEAIVFTDTAAYGMTYVGPPYVFNFELLSPHCGIVSPHAAAVTTDFVVWMGKDDFYIYDGRVRVLPCPVNSTVFDNINRNALWVTYASTNKEFEEIWWLYATGTNSVPNKYVSWNWATQQWAYGDLDRNAMVDRGVLRDVQMIGDDNILYRHEISSTAPQSCYIESGSFGASDDGTHFLFASRILPDFERIDGNVQFTFYGRQYPPATQVTKGPYTCTPTTNKIDFRLRGRQLSLRMDSSNVVWRLGTLRMNLKEDGMR